MLRWYLNYRLTDRPPGGWPAQGSWWSRVSPPFFSPNLDQPRGGRASQSEARTKQVSSGEVQKPEKGTDRLPAGGEHQPAPRVPPGPGPTEPNRGLGSREHEKLLHTPPSSLFKGKSWGKDKEMWIKNELPPVDDGACF